MANSYFQFKKFRIEQGKTAMKVCTDSCIFGAYINPDNAKSILDIGTGTGLLTLMLAQRTEASIDAVEIEENAFLQAKDNFQNSLWNHQIKLFHNSIQKFTDQATSTYDLIISNPPFFSNQLKSPNQNKNIAHHSELLSFEELSAAVNQLLHSEGKFYILLPEAEFHQFKDTALSSKLYLNHMLLVRDKAAGPIVRIIGLFSKMQNELSNDELIIKNNEGAYTEKFQSLLKDYYLHL